MIGRGRSNLRIKIWRIVPVQRTRILSPLDTIGLPTHTEHFVEEHLPPGLWSDGPEMESDKHFWQIIL